MILTNNSKIYKDSIIARSHGMIKTNKYFPGYYEMKSLGYNYRLNDMSCALGISQLKKLEKFINFRKKIAKIYDQTFKKNQIIRTPSIKSNRDHTYHLYVLRINFKKLKKTKKQLFNYFLKEGFRLQVHYIPLHTQNYFKKKYKLKNKSFPKSIKFYNEAISIPIFYGIKIKTINEFANKLLKFVEKNKKN